MPLKKRVKTLRIEDFAHLFDVGNMPLKKRVKTNRFILFSLEYEAVGNMPLKKRVKTPEVKPDFDVGFESETCR